jgi:hypothetical protein
VRRKGEDRTKRRECGEKTNEVRAKREDKEKREHGRREETRR